mmetsp:Transcript_26765/g.45147  ORF Transcript_26765/g.45147 Transcript_26765/m.45147 type:complete len:211 (-) Transcript_26765:1327-1959(-)
MLSRDGPPNNGCIYSSSNRSIKERWLRRLPRPPPLLPVLSSPPPLPPSAIERCSYGDRLPNIVEVEEVAPLMRPNRTLVALLRAETASSIKLETCILRGAPPPGLLKAPAPAPPAASVEPVQVVAVLLWLFPGLSGPPAIMQSSSSLSCECPMLLLPAVTELVPVSAPICTRMPIFASIGSVSPPHTIVVNMTIPRVVDMYTSRCSPGRF